MPPSWNPPRAGIGIRHGTAARTGRASEPVPLLPVAMNSALPPLSKQQSLGAAAPWAPREICWNSQANAQTKMPPARRPRAFAFLGRSGDRPPAGKGSQSMVSCPSYAQSANEPASRMGCAAGRLSALWREVFMARSSVLSRFLREDHGEGAHDTARYSKAQALFLAVTKTTVRPLGEARGPESE